ARGAGLGGSGAGGSGRRGPPPGGPPGPPPWRPAYRRAPGGRPRRRPARFAVSLGVLAVRRPGVRRGRVRKDLVVDLIVGIDVVAYHRDRGVGRTARHGGERDVHDVVTQAA